jgi:cation transport ATPase
MISGESNPVDKKGYHTIIKWTRNGKMFFVMIAEKLESETIFL